MCKWLLITTTENRNTGDGLIRVGVENLIKEVDPEPEFILFDKEKSDWHTPIEFDKCVLCGMPLWWSNEVSNSQMIGWWQVMMSGWVSARKKDFLILGAGDVIGKAGITNPVRYGMALQETIDKSFAVTTRNHVYDHPGLIDSVCPAAFAVTEPQEPKIRLCNFMVHGAHDRHFDPEESDIWVSKTQELSDYCRQNDFYFIEHSREGVDYRNEHPEELGWAKDRVFRFDTVEEYLPIYAQASCFFGNRLHGALLTVALGRPAIGIGYESRLGMVSRIGGKTAPPSEVSIETIKQLLEEEKQPAQIPEIIGAEKQKLIELLKRFIEL